MGTNTGYPDNVADTFKTAQQIFFLFYFLFILPHHTYNLKSKKIERIDLTMARRPKGNYEGNLFHLLYIFFQQVENKSNNAEQFYVKGTGRQELVPGSAVYVSLLDCIPSTVNVELTRKNCSYFSSRLSFQKRDWQ